MCIVEISQFSLWKCCPYCGQKILNMKTSFIGTCPKVTFHSKTPKCPGIWYGQSDSIGGRMRDTKTGNLAVAAGCYINDIGYSVSLSITKYFKNVY